MAPISQHCLLCRSDKTSRQCTIRHSRYSVCERCGSWRRESGSSSAIQQEDFKESYGDRPHIERAARSRKRLWPVLLDGIEESLAKVQSASPLSCTESRILDVGCGYGDFLSEARERGWSVEGIEINPTMRATCHEAGLSVGGTSLSDRLEARAKVDVVTYWNVLDSIEDPARELEAAKTALKERGWIWIRVPNGTFHTSLLQTVSQYRSLRRGFFNRDLSPLNAWLMTPKGLRSLLLHCGFVEIELIPAEMSHRGWLPRFWGLVSRMAARLSGGRYLLSSSITVSARLPEAVPEAPPAQQQSMPFLEGKE